MNWEMCNKKDEVKKERDNYGCKIYQSNETA